MKYLQSSSDTGTSARGPFKIRLNQDELCDYSALTSSTSLESKFILSIPQARILDWTTNAFVEHPAQVLLIDITSARRHEDGRSRLE